MLAVSDEAVQAIRRVMATAEPEVTGLRIMVVPGGCSGPNYRVGFDTAADTDDLVLDFEAFRIFIDPDSGDQLEGVRMDYVDRSDGAGFVFLNPPGRKGCQCPRAGSC